MSELPDELLSYIAGYHPPSHPIHFLVKSPSLGGESYSIHSNNSDHADGDADDDSNSLSGGGIPKEVKVVLEDGRESDDEECKTFPEEEDCTAKDLEKCPREEKSNPAYDDELEEGDFDIALDLLRDMSPPPDNPYKLFEGQDDIPNPFKLFEGEDHPVPVNAGETSSSSETDTDPSIGAGSKLGDHCNRSQAPDVPLPVASLPDRAETMPKSQNEVSSSKELSHGSSPALLPDPTACNMLPKSQNDIVRSNDTKSVNIFQRPPKSKRIVPHKGKRRSLSKPKKHSSIFYGGGPPQTKRISVRKGNNHSKLPKSSKPPPSSRKRKDGKISIHHLDRRMEGKATTLREVFDKGDLDRTKTILCARGNQSRTHELNQDRLRFIRSRLPDYIELREQNASNMEMGKFNKQAFDDYVREDPKRTFLGLNEHGEWRKLSSKEARGKLAQCFRDEWREWNKRGGEPQLQQKEDLIGGAQV